MSYVTFAWIATVLYGLEVVFGKLTSKHAIANPWLFNFVWSFLVVLLTVPIAVANHAGVPSRWENLLITSVLYALSGILYIWAIHKLDVSVLSPLFNVRTGLTVILSAVLLGEILTPVQYALVVLILVAGIFVSMDEKLSLRSFFTWPIAIGLANMVVIAFYGIYMKKTLAEVDYWTATAWIASLAQVYLLFTIPLFGRNLHKIKGRQLLGAGLMALVGGLGVLAANKGYEKNVTITSVIISLPISMIIAFIVSFVNPTLLEKHTVKVYAIRFAAASVMIIAALRLSL